MHAEDLVINESGDGYAVEDILELLPNADRVATLALVVEAVYAIDLPSLVVTSQQEKVLLELNLVGKQQNDRLERILSPVDIVSTNIKSPRKRYGG